MRAISTIAAVLLFLASCTSDEVRSGPLTGTARYAGEDDIERFIELEDGRIAFTETDLAIYQIDLVNSDEDDLVCEVRARWYDDAGVEVDSPVRSWQVVHVAGRSRTPVRSVAPNFHAVRCEVEVRLHQPIGG